MAGHGYLVHISWYTFAQSRRFAVDQNNRDFFESVIVDASNYTCDAPGAVVQTTKKMGSTDVIHLIDQTSFSDHKKQSAEIQHPAEGHPILRLSPTVWNLRQGQRSVQLQSAS
jgi:hypothetical protein